MLSTYNEGSQAYVREISFELNENEYANRMATTNLYVSSSSLLIENGIVDVGQYNLNPDFYDAQEKLRVESVFSSTCFHNWTKTCDLSSSSQHRAALMDLTRLEQCTLDITTLTYFLQSQGFKALIMGLNGKDGSIFGDVDGSSSAAISVLIDSTNTWEECLIQEMSFLSTLPR